MRRYIIILFLLTGCENSLLPKTHSRNADYDFSPPLEYVRAEPYAVYAGRHIFPDDTSISIYLIHWHGNSLDNKSMLEPDVDALGIKKYAS